MKRALVLAGGGVAGIAWELGVLRGIEEVDAALAAGLLDADVVIGTSAGSTVAAQITSGTALADLFAAQVDGASPEIEVDIELPALLARLAQAVEGAATPEERRRRIGAFALAASTVDEGTRRSVIAARLPAARWPERHLLIVAVDVATGDEVVFDRASGVALVDAVAASCAVPGVWPPVSIAGRRYMDGGVRSSANADLARGCDCVLVLSPAPPGAPTIGMASLPAELERLAPARRAVVHADAAAVAAFGTNPLSPLTRRPSAEAGRAQGRATAERIAALWR